MVVVVFRENGFIVLIIAPQSFVVMKRLLLVAVASCLGTLEVRASDVWTVPKEIDINAAHKHHHEDELTKLVHHDTNKFSSEVKSWTKSNVLPTCPSSK